MRALSDALPTGHRAMANPTLQLHFGCGRATPPVSHSHNWPSGRMQNFLFKIGQKSNFLPIKTPKLILTIEWYYRSMYCRSNAMIFFKMANLKAISSSATLNQRYFAYIPLRADAEADFNGWLGFVNIVPKQWTLSGSLQHTSDNTICI